MFFSFRAIQLFRPMEKKTTSQVEDSRLLLQIGMTISESIHDRDFWFFLLERGQKVWISDTILRLVTLFLQKILSA